MKRTGKRYTDDFLEENNEEIVYEDFELESEKSDESEYQYFDFSEDEAFKGSEESEEPIETSEKKSGFFSTKFAKVLIVLLVLLALFFASAKITEIILEHNAEPAPYETNTPDIEEDFKEINGDVVITEEENVEIPEVLGNENVTDVTPDTPEDSSASKPEQKPEPEAKPEAEKPAPQPEPEAKPEPSPSPAPKPSITPGNPAA